MKRAQKETVVADFKKLFETSQATFLVNYKGVDVPFVQSLRRELRDSGAVFKVTKARLMKIAVKDVKGAEDFGTQFKDQIGLVFVSSEEVPTAAKTIVKFSKENDALAVMSGFFESRVMSKAEVEALASLPSRDVLIATLAATLQAPIATLARALNAVKEKMEAAQGTPAVEAQPEAATAQVDDAVAKSEASEEAPVAATSEEPKE